MDDHRQDPVDTASRQPHPALLAIVYVSKAARKIEHADLIEILEGARRRNLEEQITGVLLYSDGSFMQYLEGPVAGMLRVYQIIKTHPLHYGLIDLLRQPIAVREFGEWSMACHVTGEVGNSELFDDYKALAARLASTVGQRSAAREVLSRFWTGGRKAVAISC